jgi:hypothetical protein
MKIKQICSSASFHDLIIRYWADPLGTPMDEYFLENEGDYAPTLLGRPSWYTYG